MVGILVSAYFVIGALNPIGRLIVLGLFVIVLSLWVYVAWPSYLNACRAEAVETWSVVYGPLAEGWSVIRDHTEPGCTVAYTNTIQIYPLYGFDLSRRVVYVPSRPRVVRLSDLPRMRPVIGEDVPGEVSRVMMEGSDRGTWLKNLKERGAKYLFIAKQNLGDPTRAVRPPELDFVSGAGFELMYKSAAVEVYRVDLN